MTDSIPDWLKKARGDTPQLRWSVSAESQLVDLALAYETGETVAADDSGGLGIWGRDGKLQAINRSFQDIQMIAWSHTGNGGVVLQDDNTISKVRQSLSIRWSQSFHSRVIGFDIDPFGNHIAVALANNTNLILNWKKKRVAEFETNQPLNYLQFVSTDPYLIGASEYGLMCCYEFGGTEVWSEKCWSSVGDLCLSGDGETILSAGFNQGVQCFNGQGDHRGSYMVEGTPGRVVSTFAPERMAVSTIERGLFWLDSDGELLWSAKPNEEVVGLACDPLGSGLICGLQSGRILRLDWDRS